MKRNTKIKSQRKSGKKGKRYRDGKRERETHTLTLTLRTIETMIDRGLQRETKGFQQRETNREGGCKQGQRDERKQRPMCRKSGISEETGVDVN